MSLKSLKCMSNYLKLQLRNLNGAKTDRDTDSERNRYGEAERHKENVKGCPVLHLHCCAKYFRFLGTASLKIDTRHVETA